MWFRHTKALLIKVLLLAAMLLIVTGGLTGLGCIKGLQPIGWSGGVVVDGPLTRGSRLSSRGYIHRISSEVELKA